MKTSQSYAFTQSFSVSLFEVRVVFVVVHDEVAKPALMANDRTSSRRLLISTDVPSTTTKRRIRPCSCRLSLEPYGRP